ncbi:MAG: DoxX family protein [Pirellulales bacterium]
MSIGWHFFQSGLEKYTDPGFTSAGFLSQAKGPLAPFYHDLIPGAHDWRRLLAIPRYDDPSKAEIPSERDIEALEGDEELADEQRVPEGAPYRSWAVRIVDDWEETLREFNDEFKLKRDQQEAAAEVFDQRAAQLRYYLWDNWAGIAEYRHELWRLQQMRESGISSEVPFQEERIAGKSAETAGAPGKWVSGVQKIENGYFADLWQALSPEQQEAAKVASVHRLQERPGETVDRVVTYVTLGVGVSLILGLFTRLGAVVGGLFLLSVLSTQPPWIAATELVYYQIVELVALFALAATPVGRWGGLDFFIHRLWANCCGGKGGTS